MDIYYKALLFDCDGTIVPDAEDVHKQCVARTLEDLHGEHDVAFDPDFFSAIWLHELGKGIANFYQKYVADSAALSARITTPLEEQVVVFENRYQAKYRESAGSMAVRQGVQSLISEAKKKGILVAVVSNAKQDILEHTLQSCRLQDIDLVLGKDEVEKHGYKAKPDGGAYLCAIEMLSRMTGQTITPEMTVGFEDSMTGYRSMVDAGLGHLVYCQNDMTASFNKTADNQPEPHTIVRPSDCLYTVMARIVPVPEHRCRPRPLSDTMGFNR